MSPDKQSRTFKIEKYSDYAKRVFQILAAFYLLSLLAWIAVIAFAPISASWGIKPGSSASIWSIGFFHDAGNGIYRTILVDRITGVGTKVELGLVVILFHVWVLKFWYHLYKLSSLYALGEIFTIACICQIRQLGFNTALGFAAQFLAPLLVYLLMRSGNQPYLPPVDAQLGSIVSFWPLLAGAVIVFVSWVMDVGREINDENRDLEADNALVI